MFTLNPTRSFGLLESFLASRRANIANKFIPAFYRKGRILDIGCGVFPVFLLKTDFKEKYGMDSALKIIKTGRKNIHFSSLNAEKGKPLPFRDNFFDVIVLLAVLEHLEGDSVEFILSEIRRVLKKNGRFILTTPSPWAGGLLKLMARLRLISQEEINDHKGSRNYYKVVAFLRKVGFNQSDIRKGHFEFFLNNWVYADKQKISPFFCYYSFDFMGWFFSFSKN